MNKNLTRKPRVGSFEAEKGELRDDYIGGIPWIPDTFYKPPER